MSMKRNQMIKLAVLAALGLAAASAEARSAGKQVVEMQSTGRTPMRVGAPDCTCAARTDASNCS